MPIIAEPIRAHLCRGGLDRAYAAADAVASLRDMTVAVVVLEGYGRDHDQLAFDVELSLLRKGYHRRVYARSVDTRAAMTSRLWQAVRELRSRRDADAGRSLSTHARAER